MTTEDPVTWPEYEGIVRKVFRDSAGPAFVVERRPNHLILRLASHLFSIDVTLDRDQTNALALFLRAEDETWNEKRHEVR